MKYLILGLAILSFAGCTVDEPLLPTPTPSIRVVTEPIQRPQLNLPTVDPYRPQNVDWVVITPENADSIFAELERQGVEQVVFGIDEDSYEALAINNQQALRTILQQQSQIDGYREYYLRTDRAITRHNNSLNQDSQ